YLDRWNARRRELAAAYRGAFADLADRLPVVEQAPWTSAHAWHLFVVRSLAVPRDRLLRELHERNIGAGIHYPTPIHRQACFAELGGRAAALPATERLSEEVVSLPLCPALTDAELASIVSAVRSVLDGRATNS